MRPASHRQEEKYLTSQSIIARSAFPIKIKLVMNAIKALDSVNSLSTSKKITYA